VKTQPTPEVVLASSGKLKWVPSAQFPYVPAFAPSTQELYFKTLPDGTLQPIIQLKDKAHMDYDKHGTTTSFGPTPKDLDLSQAAVTMDKISKGVKRLNDATKELNELPDDQDATPELTTFVNPVKYLETSEAAAWFTGAVQRMTAIDGKIPDVYRIYAAIAEPIISMTDESDIVENFRSSNTYIELREKMNASINTVSPALWAHANKKATETINRVLKQNTSLSLTIESFVVDIQETVDYLGTKYGTTIQSAFLKHQKQVIGAMFENMGNAAAEMESSILDGLVFAEDARPKITFVASQYSLTYLNCVSYELDIELQPGISSAVLSDSTPAIHALISGLFKDVEERGGNFLRHLIRTNDGRILEAARGYVGADFLMVTLVN
jgi:hypothetical protein